MRKWNSTSKDPLPPRAAFRKIALVRLIAVISGIGLALLCLRWRHAASPPPVVTMPSLPALPTAPPAEKSAPGTWQMSSAATERESMLPPARLEEKLRRDALTYRQGRDNIYFREEEFLKQLAGDGARGVSRIKDELRSLSELESLPAGTRIAETKPRQVMERMGMIDILEGFLSHELGDAGREVVSATQTALRDLMLDPLPAGISLQTKRILVAEKFDCLVVLARHQRESALSIFAQITDARLRESLRPALLGGLLDSGMNPDEAEKLLRPL